MESLSISGAVSHCWFKNKDSLLLSKILKCCKAVGEAFFGKYRVSVAENRESILLHGNLKFSKELKKLCEHHTRILDTHTTLYMTGHAGSKIDFQSVCHRSDRDELDSEADKVISAVLNANYRTPFSAVVDPNYRKDNYVAHLEKARMSFEQNLQSIMADAMPEIKIEQKILKKMFLENIKKLARSGWPKELTDNFQSSAYTNETLDKECYVAIPLLCELASRTVENARTFMNMDTEARKAKILSLKELMDEHAMTSTLHRDFKHDSVDELWDRAFGEKWDSLAFCQLCLGAAVAEAYRGALEGYKEFIGRNTDKGGAISPATVGAFWADILAVKNSKWNHINLHV